MKNTYFVLFLITLFVGAASVYGGPTNTIQQKINDANDGDVILVENGTYYGNLVINKSIKLKSRNGPENCTIDCSNSSIVIEADGVTIEGFTIRNSTGIIVNSDNNIIKNNKILNSTYGIYLNYLADDNNITNNTLLNNDHNIIVYRSNNNYIYNNNITVTGNSSGISLFHSEYNHITNNDIMNCSWADGISLSYSEYNHITKNDIINGERGIYLYYSYSNYITYNNINNNSKYGIYSYDSNNNIIAYNNISNNYYSIGLSNSDNNKIYLNNFINNSYTHIHDSNNSWNSPEKITYTYNNATYTNYLGNYWKGYNSSDTDGDGIWDSPYHIGSGSDADVDYYPLRYPWGVSYTNMSWNVVCMQVDNLTMTVGEEKQISLMLLKSSGVGGLNITIYFNESVINITNVTAGDFNKSSPDFSNISDGILRITCMKEGEDLVGNLVIAHLKIKALSGGTSPLNLTAHLTTSTGNEVNESVKNATVVVNQNVSGDVNNDREVNIEDAVLLWNWASYPNDRGSKYIINEINADVNGNETVDFGDAVLLWNWVAFPNKRGEPYVLK